MSEIATKVMEKIKIIIFDDHDSVRESYKRWMELEGFEIVGEEKSVENCIPVLKKLKPDIILMDIDFHEKERGGLTALKRITKEVNNAKIIIVSHYNEPAIIVEAFNSGARGYFTKADELKFLKETIEKVYDNYVSTSPSATKSLIKAAGEKSNRTTPIVKKDFNLTPQENLVLNYIAQGLTNKEIARELSSNEKRIKNITANMLLKIDAKNRAQAVAKGIVSGLIDTMHLK